MATAKEKELEGVGCDAWALEGERAVLRRTEAGGSEYLDEQLSIDFARMSLKCEGREVRLTRKEFALLTAWRPRRPWAGRSHSTAESHAGAVLNLRTQPSYPS